MRLILSPLVLALFGPPPHMEESEADLRAIQGEWVFSVQKYEGRKLEIAEGWRLLIRGSRMTYLFRGTATAVCDLRLDASTHPKRFTFMTNGDTVGTRGIYRLEKGRLQLCYDVGGEHFPRSLEQIGHHFYFEAFDRN